MNALAGNRTWLGLALLALLAGCSALKPKKPKLDSAAGMFDEASLSYQVETSRIASTRGNVEGRLVSYQPQAQELPPDCTARLKIEFPHPAGRKDAAQVTVTIVEASGTSSAGGSWWRRAANSFRLGGKESAREVWVLDISREEMSALVSQLHNEGYFAGYDSQETTTQLETELDGAKLNKAWRQVPQLDALVLRVRTQGRLLSSPSADEPNEMFRGLAGPLPTSVAAYRKLLADDDDDDGAEGMALISDLPAGDPLPGNDAFQVVRLPAVGNAPIRR